MKETEITVQVFNNYNDIDEILKRDGFQMIENYQLYDWYFSKFDQKDVLNSKIFEQHNHNDNF